MENRCISRVDIVVVVFDFIVDLSSASRRLLAMMCGPEAFVVLYCLINTLFT